MLLLKKTNNGVLFVMPTKLPGVVYIGHVKNEHYKTYMDDGRLYDDLGLGIHQQAFAIEVTQCEKKKQMLYDLFAGCRIPESSLFVLEIDIIIQMLLSFDGKVLYPATDNREDLFAMITEYREIRKNMPHGLYVLLDTENNDSAPIEACAQFSEGRWILLKDSIVALEEKPGLSKKARSMRALLPLDDAGKMIDDFDLGHCTPDFAASIVKNQPCDGWLMWKDSDGNLIEKYRVLSEAEEWDRFWTRMMEE